MSIYVDVYARDFKQDDWRELQKALRARVLEAIKSAQCVRMVVQYDDLTALGKHVVKSEGLEKVKLNHVKQSHLFAQYAHKLVVRHDGHTRVLKDRWAVDMSPPNDLEVGGVYRCHDGTLVKLDRQVPGDGTAWYAATWSEQMRAWTNDDARIEPSDLAVESEDPEGA